MKKELFIPVLILGLMLIIWPGDCYSVIVPEPRKTHIFFGAQVNYNYSLANDLRLTFLKEESATNHTFTGNGYSIGGFYQLFVGDIVDTKVSFFFSVNYSYNGLSGTSQVSNINKYIDTANYKVNIIGRNSPLGWEVRNIMETVDFKILCNFKIIQDLYVSFGPVFTFIAENRQTEKVEVTEDFIGEVQLRDDLSPLMYEDNKTKAVLFDDEPIGINKLVIGLNAQLTYEMITGTGLDLLPYIGIGTTLTSVAARSKWKINSFYAGIAFRYSFKF